MIQILAHRGANKERPENTMAAFRRARELGADGVEFDVYYLIKDGSLVIQHDPNLGRCEDAQGASPTMTETPSALSAWGKNSPRNTKTKKSPSSASFWMISSKTPCF